MSVNHRYKQVDPGSVEVESGTTNTNKTSEKPLKKEEILDPDSTSTKREKQLAAWADWVWMKVYFNPWQPQFYRFKLSGGLLVRWL
jgi:hypothetical protein